MGTRSTAGSTIDGTKEGIPCRVVDVDSVFTREAAEDLMRTLAAERIDRCHCLAWEFAVNLPTEIGELEQKHGVRLRLVEIPREIIDVPGRKMPWFQAGVVKVEAVFSVTPQGNSVDIRLDRFMREPANAAFNESDRPKSSVAGNGANLIDFWAVDFDWRPDKPFNQHWQEYRSRKSSQIEMVSGARFVHKGLGNHSDCHQSD